MEPCSLVCGNHMFQRTAIATPELEEVGPGLAQGDVVGPGHHVQRVHVHAVVLPETNLADEPAAPFAEGEVVTAGTLNQWQRWITSSLICHD